jgi:hypothetical protein
MMEVRGSKSQELVGEVEELVIIDWTLRNPVRRLKHINV